jgi:hypothetical protein
MDDYLYHDEPLLAVRIVSFKDATLLSVGWHHCLTDIVGFGCFMKAWMAMVNGKENDVPRFIGYDKDPLAAIGTQKPDIPAKLLEGELKGLKKLKFILGILFENYCRGSANMQAFCLSAEVIQHYKAQAMVDIKAKDGPQAFISDGDIVAAVSDLAADGRPS